MKKKYTKWIATLKLTLKPKFATFFGCLKQALWASECLPQQQLWQQVTGKKGKLLKWMEGSMEAQTGMANNPFFGSFA